MFYKILAVAILAFIANRGLRKMVENLMMNIYYPSIYTKKDLVLWGQRVLFKIMKTLYRWRRQKGQKCIYYFNYHHYLIISLV